MSKPWHQPQDADAWMKKAHRPLDTLEHVEVWARGRLMATVWQHPDETPEEMQQRANRYARTYSGEVIRA